MKIHYSPYYNGKAYVGRDLLGECLLETCGLLDRLELICGLTQDDVDETQRAQEYLEALLEVAQNHKTYQASLKIDQNDLTAHPEKPALKAATELLRWRDQLILASWDRQSSLPSPKLALLADAETKLNAQGMVRRGSADRWLALGGHLSLLANAKLQIEVDCPRVLIPLRVADIIERLCGKEAFVGNRAKMKISEATIVKCDV